MPAHYVILMALMLFCFIGFGLGFACASSLSKSKKQKIELDPERIDDIAHILYLIINRTKGKLNF